MASQITNHFFRRTPAELLRMKRNAKVEQDLLENEYFGYIVEYAEKVIKGRWPQAEARMIKKLSHFVNMNHIPDDDMNPVYTIRDIVLQYILRIIQGRWKEVEPLLRRDQVSWIMYTRLILDKYGVQDVGTDQSTLGQDIDLLLDII